MPRKARPAAVRKAPQQSAERRAGHRYWPVISGGPEIDPTARRVTGAALPHQRLSALCSPQGEREIRKTPGATRRGNENACPQVTLRFAPILITPAVGP
jgi:hypothetical protein